MTEIINFESIAKYYKCAVAAKYRPLKPEEISTIPLGNNFVSKKIDGEYSELKRFEHRKN